MSAPARTAAVRRSHRALRQRPSAVRLPQRAVAARQRRGLRMRLAAGAQGADPSAQGRYGELAGWERQLTTALLLLVGLSLLQALLR